MRLKALKYLTRNNNDNDDEYDDDEVRDEREKHFVSSNEQQIFA